MNRDLILALAVPCLCFLPLGCSDPPAAVEAPPVKERPKPKVFRPADLEAEAAAREGALDREIAALETEAESLRQEIAREQLKLDQAALQEEQARLEEERTALLEALPLPALPVTTLEEVDSSPLPPAGDYDLFYTGLSAHGQWFESVDYGYVWQPAVARQASWRPYTVGCWTACDRGWVWLSDEPFGWATYHYGRWACLKDRGWIWVPGEIWAPAWVAWRRSPEYVGWCPLPPETLHQTSTTYDATIDQRLGLQSSSYIFIAAKHFCLPVHRHGEPVNHSARICRNTTNITRLVVSRHGVDRCGPAYDWIRKCLGHDPPLYRLACGNRPQQGAHFLIRDGRLCLYAPRIHAPWNPLLRPPTPAGKLTLAVADRQDATPPDKALKAFREARRSWQARASSALKETPVRRFAERQEQIRSRQSTLAATVAGTSRAGEPTPVPTTTLSSVQRRELKEAATRKIANQRQQLSRMRGQDVPASLTVRASQASPSAPPGPGRRLATPARLPAPATAVRTMERPGVANTSKAVPPPPRPNGPEPMPSPAQPAAAGQPPPPAFRHAITTAQIPGLLDSRVPPGADTGTPPAPIDRQIGGSADLRAAQVARLKDEIAGNRKALMDRRSGSAPASANPLPQPASEELIDGTGPQPAAGLRQWEAQARQQALAEAEAEAIAAAEAAAAAQQAMTAAQARAEAGARRNQQDRDAAHKAEQARIQRAAQHDQQQAARAQQMSRQQEAARQQQMADQQQRQAEAIARQQEAARQQQIAEQQQRQAEAIARQQEAARQQQIAEQQQRQAEAIARQQEVARQQQMADQQQRQAEAIARQQEAARQQQMAEQRQRQAEETARQKEAARQQQESEQRQRQADEASRQQEAVRQQKASEEGARRRTGR